MGADRLAAPDVTGPAGMARLLERMHHPRSWSLVALEPHGGLAGHILFWPARDDDGAEIEGVAGSSTCSSTRPGSATGWRPTCSGAP